MWKNCNVFRRTDSINEKLDNFLQFKGEARKVKNKIVKYNSYILAQIGSCFDSYVVLNNPYQWQAVVSLNKTDQALYLSKISKVM